MKIYTINQDVNDDMLAIVTNAIQEEWNITFYLKSTWWSWYVAQQIIDMINQNSDRVTLIANDYIASAAFRIFFYCTCKRKVLPHTMWMWHMARIDTSISGKKRIQSVPKIQLDFMWKEAKEDIKFMKSIWMKEKLCKKFLNEFDVYFWEKELKKLLSWHEKLLKK